MLLSGKHCLATSTGRTISQRRFPVEPSLRLVECTGGMLAAEEPFAVFCLLTPLGGPILSNEGVRRWSEIDCEREVVFRYNMI